jgi:hypothetical protein
MKPLQEADFLNSTGKKARTRRGNSGMITRFELRILQTTNKVQQKTVAALYFFPIFTLKKPPLTTLLKDLLATQN